MLYTIFTRRGNKVITILLVKLFICQITPFFYTISLLSQYSQHFSRSIHKILKKPSIDNATQTSFFYTDTKIRRRVGCCPCHTNKSG